MMLHNEFMKALTLLFVITQKNVKIIYYMEYCLTMQLPIIATIFFQYGKITIKIASK